MRAIENWNEIKVPQKFEKIELGGHYCKIVSAKVETTKSGYERLAIAFDFAPNDKQAGYFKEMYDRDRETEGDYAKWRGVYYQLFGTEKSNGYFKQMIENILSSNNGYTWNWDEKTLKGKLFGGVFGKENYLNSSGELKSAVKCRYIIGIDGVPTAEIPNEINPSGTQTTASSIPDISDDDLPF